MTKWAVVDGVRMSLLSSEISLAPTGFDVTDVTGQPADPITGEARTTPDVLIVLADNVANGVWNAIKADPRYFVLMSQSWDTGDPDTLLTNTYDNVVTAGQVTTFINAIQAAFPDVQTEHLEDAGEAAIQAGLTREQVRVKLIRRWAKFLKRLITQIATEGDEGIVTEADERLGEE